VRTEEEHISFYFLLKKRILNENEHIRYVFEVIKAISATVLWYVVPFRQDGTDRPLLTNSRISPRLEHSRHRSPINFVVHLITGLIAYSHQDKKPGLHLDQHALLAA